jgi:hypothetical protein
MISVSINDDGKSIDLCYIKYESPTLSAKQIQTFVGNVKNILFKFADILNISLSEQF